MSRSIIEVELPRALGLVGVAEVGPVAAVDHAEPMAR